MREWEEVAENIKASEVLGKVLEAVPDKWRDHPTHLDRRVHGEGCIVQLVDIAAGKYSHYSLVTEALSARVLAALKEELRKLHLAGCSDQSCRVCHSLVGWNDYDADVESVALLVKHAKATMEAQGD